MDELIDKFKIKNAIYEMRNKKLSDADMEIWHLINELPADVNKEKVIQQMEQLLDVAQDDSVAEQVSTRIWNKAIQACIQIVKAGGVNASKKCYKSVERMK
jgi:hypothetical protein